MSDLTEKSPRIFDYLAAGILANGLVYFWEIALDHFPMLEILSIPVFLVIGFITSWLVLNRLEAQNLKLGALTGLVSWVITVFMMYSLTDEPALSYIPLLLGCYLAGGLGAALFLQLKSKNDDKIDTPPPESAQDQ